jgi:hypothetical protein
MTLKEWPVQSASKLRPSKSNGLRTLHLCVCQNPHPFYLAGRIA